MKKNKKWLSIVLAVILALSSLSAVGLAFAADANAIEKLRSDIESATVTDKEISDPTIVNRFKALTDDEKDSLGVWYVNQLFGLFVKTLPGSPDEETIFKKQDDALGYSAKMLEGQKAYRNLLTGTPIEATRVDGSATDIINVRLQSSFNFNKSVTYTVRNESKQYIQYVATVDVQKKVAEWAISYLASLDDTVKGYVFSYQNQIVYEPEYAYMSGAVEMYGFRSTLMRYADVTNYKAPDVPPYDGPAKPSESDLPISPAYTEYQAKYKLYSTLVNYGDTIQQFIDQGQSFKQAIATLVSYGIFPAESVNIPETSIAELGTTYFALAMEEQAQIAANKEWQKNSPEYIEYQKNLEAYNAAYKVWEKEKSKLETVAHETAIMPALNAFSAEDRAAIEDVKKLADALTNYWENTNQTDADKKNVTKALDQYYTNNSAYAKYYVIDKLGEVAFIYSNGKAYKINEVREAVNTVALEPVYKELLAAIDAVKESDMPADAKSGSREFNQIISNLRSLYGRLNGSWKNTLKNDEPDRQKKYDKINSLWWYIPYTDYSFPAHNDEFVADKEELKAEGTLAELLNALLPKAGGAIGGLVQGLMTNPATPDAAYSVVFSNDLITSLLKLAMPALGGLQLGASAVMSNLATPAGYAADNKGALLESTYNALIASASWDTVPVGLDWGVVPGDDNSFVEALINALTPVLGLVTLTDLFSNSSTYDKAPENKDFNYGLYELVILPLYDILGIKDAISSEEFTATFSGKLDIQGEWKTVINQMLPFIKQLLANPIDTLISVLPNLMYHLKDGCLYDGIGGAVNKLLNSLGQSMDLSGVLNWDTIKGLLDSLLASTGLSVDSLGLERIANMGKATEVKSLCANTDTVRFIEADKESVYNYLVNTVSTLLTQFTGMTFDASEFVKQEIAAYPHDGKMDAKVMNAMIDGLDGLLGGFININDLINNGLATNVMAADAVQAIYTAISSLNLGDFKLGGNYSPALVASQLTEDKYKDLRAALSGNDIASWNDVALVVKNGDVVYDCVDMGFKDGDRQGFIDSMVACLRPLASALADGLINTLNDDGTTKGAGLYDLVIIPLFEDLGLTPAASSEQYTSNYNKLAKQSDKGSANDYLLKTILAPVMDLLNDFAAAPAKTLFTVLPNIAYQLQHGEILGLVGSVLNNVLGTDGTFNLAATINGFIANLIPGFELPNINLDLLASCGELTTASSKSSIRDNYSVVKANTADAFVTTFYYLYDTINYKDNLKTISDLLAGIEGLDPSLAGMIDTILNDVFTRGKEEALCMLGTILAADVWECPDGDGNNGGKTPATGDYTVPAIAVLAVMFTAGAAIMVLRKKKVTE